jgi:NAD(P)-dependent dehydrogenase (short-subunit alcohol dehydrogenase family)
MHDRSGVCDRRRPEHPRFCEGKEIKDLAKKTVPSIEQEVAPSTQSSASDKVLKGMTALVTGAAQGLGKGIAIELARAGCAVAVNYRTHPELAQQVVEEIAVSGGEAFKVHGDIRSAAQVNRMFALLAERFKELDILVNNAAAQTWAPLLELKESDWDRDIETNLKGSFLCLQAAGRWMKQTHGGSIINIGSGCNKLPFPRLVAYSTSKGGIEMLTKIAAIELGRYRIRVNCVAPGAVLIDRTRKEDPEYAAIWGNQASLGRVGTPEDIGNAVVYLASHHASYVTGQTLWVDGGAFTKPSWPYALEDEDTATLTEKMKKAKSR